MEKEEFEKYLDGKRKELDDRQKEIEDYLTSLMVLTDERVVDFYKANKDVVCEIDHLTELKLKEDLEEAVKYQHGYFKNKKGKYRFLKGIEVTNDVSNLCRMGFNGEDNGVWVHYCEVDDRKVEYHDVPVAVFTWWLSPNCVDADSLFEPTTKEDFDEQVKKTVDNIISEYQEKRDANEYLEFLNNWSKLCDQVRKEYTETPEAREKGIKKLTS